MTEPLTPEQFDEAMSTRGDCYAAWPPVRVWLQPMDSAPRWPATHLGEPGMLRHRPETRRVPAAPSPPVSARAPER